MIWGNGRISLARPVHAGGEAKSLQLGGTRLWSDEEFDLSGAVDMLERRITKCADSVLLTCTRAVLQKVVAQSLDEERLDDRIFGAVLGRAEQKGLIDEMLVGSKNDKPFRAYFSTQNTARVHGCLGRATTLLARKGRLQVRELESELFKIRQYNTWSCASHFLSRLSYLGTARALDQMTFEYVDLSKLRYASDSRR